MAVGEAYEALFRSAPRFLKEKTFDSLGFWGRGHLNFCVRGDRGNRMKYNTVTVLRNYTANFLNWSAFSDKCLSMDDVTNKGL